MSSAWEDAVRHNFDTCMHAMLTWGLERWPAEDEPFREAFFYTRIKTSF